MRILFSYNVGRLFLTKVLIDGLTELATFEIRLKMIEWFAILTDLLFFFTFLLSAELLFSSLARGASGSMRSGEEACFS